MSMDKLLNVATPFTAATVVVPLRVPLLGFVPIAMVIEAALVVTKLPFASCTCTATAGVIACVAVVLEGCWLKASLDAAPAVMLKLVLVAEVSPVLVADKV